MLQHIFECEILADGEFRQPKFDKGVNISCEIIADKYMVYTSDVSDEKLAELTAKYSYLGTSNCSQEPLHLLLLLLRLL